MACPAMLDVCREVDGSLRWRETQVWKSEARARVLDVRWEIGDVDLVLL